MSSITFFVFGQGTRYATAHSMAQLLMFIIVVSVCSASLLRRTTSTVQDAWAVTELETLPIKSRRNPLKPRPFQIMERGTDTHGIIVGN
jgi:hypothetical protein